jgi:hypothetical protein
MRHQLFWTAVAMTVSATALSAQQAPAKQVSAVGSWNAKTMMGVKDSVVTTYTFTVAPDGKSATLKFPDRNALASRIVAMAGDSIVTETGPYPSVLRAGQTVKLLRNVSHVKGDEMWGTFEAKYSNGDVTKGKTQATRVM